MLLRPFETLEGAASSSRPTELRPLPKSKNTKNLKRKKTYEAFIPYFENPFASSSLSGTVPHAWEKEDYLRFKNNEPYMKAAPNSEALTLSPTKNLSNFVSNNLNLNNPAVSGLLYGLDPLAPTKINKKLNNIQPKEVKASEINPNNPMVSSLLYSLNPFASLEINKRLNDIGPIERPAPINNVVSDNVTPNNEKGIKQFIDNAIDKIKNFTPAIKEFFAPTNYNRLVDEGVVTPKQTQQQAQQPQQPQQAQQVQQTPNKASNNVGAQQYIADPTVSYIVGEDGRIAWIRDPSKGHTEFSFNPEAYRDALEMHVIKQYTQGKKPEEITASIRMPNNENLVLNQDEINRVINSYNNQKILEARTQRIIEDTYRNPYEAAKKYGLENIPIEHLVRAQIEAQKRADKEFTVSNPGSRWNIYRY